jgi:hypothetical protein
MKLVKMSLAAAMLMGASAYAEVKNVKFDGQAKLLYQTTESSGNTADLFDKGPSSGVPAFGQAAAGGAVLTLGASADVGQGFNLGAEMQAVSTMGLENNLVSATMWGSRVTGTTGILGTSTDAGALNAWNVSQAYIAKTFGNTTFKIGRQELDTPLAFTEKWNVGKNTFEAAVLVNSDIPNTTLVAAFVGNHNGGGSNVFNFGGFARTAVIDDGAGGTGFTQFGLPAYASDGTTRVHGDASGAYAVGAVVTPMDNLAVQAWYYNVVSQADAFWLQADMKNIADMVSVGAQYASLSPDAAGLDDSTIYAVKVAADFAGVNVFAAYSDADEDGVAGFSNVATGDKTKIYTGTGSIYMDGVVTAPGTSTYKVGASTKAGGVKLAASYADASDMNNAGDMNAWDVKASGNVAGVGLTAIYQEMENEGTGTFGNNDLTTLRIIASVKF